MTTEENIKFAQSETKRGFSYLFAAFLIMLASGTIYTYSIFKKPLEQLFAVSGYISSIPFMTLLFFFAFSMPFSGYFIEKKGIKKVYMFGAFFVAISWFLSSFAANIHQFIFTYGVLGGIGVGLVYGVPIRLAPAWFPHNRGLATGFALAGFGLSSFINAYFFRKLIAKYGIMDSFMIVSFFALAVYFILSFKVKMPDSYGDMEDEEHKGDEYKEMLSKKEFYLIYFLFMFACLISLTVISFTAVYAMNNLSMGFKRSAVFVGNMALLNTLGRPVYGILADKLGIQKAIFISYGKYVLALSLMLLFPGNFYVFMFSFSLLWFNLGAWLSIAPVASMKFFGMLHYPKNYGIMYTAYGLGALMGITSLYFLTYEQFFHIAIALAIAGFTAAFFVKRIDFYGHKA